MPEKQYMKFCYIMKAMSFKLSKYKINSAKNILKLIDEYNYSKYTKEWV